MNLRACGCHIAIDTLRTWIVTALLGGLSGFALEPIVQDCVGCKEYLGLVGLCCICDRFVPFSQDCILTRTLFH